jgi:hypothetical protein
MRITACRGHASTEQQLGGSTDWAVSLAKMNPQALRRGFVSGISDKYYPP